MRPLRFRRGSAFGLGQSVGLFHGFFVHQITDDEVGVTGISNADLSGDGLVTGSEVVSVHNFFGQELGVAGLFHHHLAEHARKNDLNMFV